MTSKTASNKQVKNSTNTVNTVLIWNKNIDTHIIEGKKIWNNVDKKNFKKFVESFDENMENNKVILSKFLNSKNIKISELWDMKIDINNIKNFVRNKPDFPKYVEEQIAKLFIKNLYERWKNTTWFKDEFENEFWSIDDIDGKNYNFKTIQVYINGFSEKFAKIIESTTVSNDKIFNALGLNTLQTLDKQTPQNQAIILDILQFEAKDLMWDIWTHWEEIEKDTERLLHPTLSISEIFDKVHDPEIEKLTVEKWELEDNVWNNPEVAKQVENINKTIWKKYIDNLEKSGEDQKIISVLKKLCACNFDFSKLDKSEQTTLWQTLVVDKINEWNYYLGYLWVNQEKFNSLLKDLYNFEKNESNIDIDWVWTLNLHITKETRWWKNSVFMDIEKFKNMDELNPVKFTVNIDNNDENIIKDIEDTKDSPFRISWIMETHITKWWKLNIWNGYKLEICGKIITKSQLDELLNCDVDEIELCKKLKEFWLYGDLKDLISSAKTEISDQENNDSNTNQYWKSDIDGQKYKTNPSIFEKVLKNLDVKVLEKNLVFEWKNVDKLSQLYLLSCVNQNNIGKLEFNQDAWLKYKLSSFSREWDEANNIWTQCAERIIEQIWEIFDDDSNAENNDTEIDAIKADAQGYYNNLDETQKQSFKDELHRLGDDLYPTIIDDIIDDLYDWNTDGDTDDIADIPDELKNVQQEEKEETEDEKLSRLWDSIPGDKNCKLEKWNKIFLNLWGSKLPPHDGPNNDDSYFSFEIVDVSNRDFTIKAISWDLKSSLSWKTFVLPKTSEQLQRMKDGWWIYKVSKCDNTNWWECIKAINKAWLVKKFTAFGEMEWQVQLKWTKFVNEKWEEIKYFNRIESSVDFDNKVQKPNITKYEIKWVNNNKWTVKLACKFNWFDENWSDVLYDYENDLPFEQFILLIEWKKLKWYTKNEQDELETKYEIDDPKRLAWKWLRKRFSIKDFVSVFKWAWKAISDKIKKRNEEQKEDLENFLFSQEWANLYWKLWKIFSLWWMIWSVEDAFAESQYEFYVNRENRTWKKIERWYKIFDSETNYSELYNEHLLKILQKPGYQWDSKDRYKFAAALLVMVKNEWPYPRDFTQDIWKWNWVEKLLWPEHKTRFLNFYEKKKAELEQERDLWHKAKARLNLQEELNKMEFQYIISCIEWNAPYGPGQNEFMLKSIWSTKFSGQLKDNFDWYFTKHEETKKKLSTFSAAEEQFLRTLKQWRFSKALPSLEAMCEKAVTPEEAFRTKWYFLAAMLTWVIKNNSSSNTIKSFWSTARSMWFPPGYWVRDVEQQDKVKILLDGITNGAFSKETWFKTEDFDLWNLKDWKYNFAYKFGAYRKKHGRDILKKIENPAYKSDDNDKSIMDLAAMWDHNSYVFEDIVQNSTTNDIDGKNPEVSTIFAACSPGTATSDMINNYIPRNWNYNLKNPEDLWIAQTQWKEAKECIPSWRADKNQTNYWFKKYFNRFDSTLSDNEVKKIIRSLPLIKETAKNWNAEQARFLLWYMIKWTLHKRTSWDFPGEVGTVMNKFVDFFFTNIDQIDEKTINFAFKKDKPGLIGYYSKPYKMLNWEQFNLYHMTDFKATKWWDKSKYDRLVNIWCKNNNLSVNDDIINYEIESMWRDIKKYCEPAKYMSSTTSDGLPKFPVYADPKDISKREQASNKLLYDDGY